MNMSIILGDGQICLTAGLFEETATKKLFTAIKMEQLKRPYKMGEDVTNPEDIDTKISFMIQCKNIEAVEALERAVALLRKKQEALDEHILHNKSSELLCENIKDQISKL